MCLTWSSIQERFCKLQPHWFCPHCSQEDGAMSCLICTTTHINDIWRKCKSSCLVKWCLWSKALHIKSDWSRKSWSHLDSIIVKFTLMRFWIVNNQIWRRWFMKIRIDVMFTASKQIIGLVKWWVFLQSCCVVKCYIT